MKSLPHYSKKFNKWLGRRRWRIFIFCLPTLVAALILLVVAGLYLGHRSGEASVRYERLVKVALGQKKFEVARVASLRGLAGAKNERDHAQWVFYLAMAMGGLGQRQDAMALTSEAAPLDPPGAGNIDAHLMVAQTLLSNTNLTSEAVRVALANPANPTAKILHEAERHLLSALAIESNSLEANEMLGRFYLNIHQPEKARVRLMKIYAARPETALLLALEADMEGDSAKAVEWAERAITVYEHKLIQTAPRFNLEDRQALVRALLVERKYTKTPSLAPAPGGKPELAVNSAFEDSPTFWLGIVRLLIINGKTGEALQTLEQRSGADASIDYRSQIGDVCVLMAQSLPAKTPEAQLARLRYIQEGITNAPWNVNLMYLLTQAANSGNGINASAKTLLAEQIAAAPKPYLGYWHFMAARDADDRGDKALSREELRVAHELAPRDPQVANQTAYYELTSTKPEDWEEGLKIINSVLSQCPDDFPSAPEYHGTRGLLLARMGRGKEAAADLEIAVAKMPDATESLQALAKIRGTVNPVFQGGSADVIRQTREMMNNGDFATAAKTLERSVQMDTNPSYAAALGDVCAAWVEYLPASQHEERVRIIKKGLAHDPQHAKLQAMLIQATHADDAAGHEASELLAQLAAGATGQASAEWRFLWGQDARKRGDLATARKQLELAYTADPQNTEVEIELARILVNGSPSDLTRALGLIEPAIAQYPDSAEFRNVRGQILAGLHRNEDAQADLSFAVDRLLDPRDVAEARRSLVKVYEALGKTQKALEERHMLENP